MIFIRLNAKAYGAFKLKYLFKKQNLIKIYHKYDNSNNLDYIIRYNKLLPLFITLTTILLFALLLIAAGF